VENEAIVAEYVASAIEAEPPHEFRLVDWNDLGEVTLQMDPDGNGFRTFRLTVADITDKD
jgi:hypothetical protein